MISRAISGPRALIFDTCDLQVSTNFEKINIWYILLWSRTNWTCFDFPTAKPRSRFRGGNLADRRPSEHVLLRRSAQPQPVPLHQRRMAPIPHPGSQHVSGGPVGLCVPGCGSGRPCHFPDLAGTLLQGSHPPRRQPGPGSGRAEWFSAPPPSLAAQADSYLQSQPPFAWWVSLSAVSSDLSPFV